VAIAVFAAALMMVTNQVPTVAASGQEGSGGGSGGNSTADPMIPYYIPPTLFPVPSNYSVNGTVTASALAPLPASVASYAVAYSTANASGSFLWFDSLGYDPSDARQIAETGTCGVTCGDLPLSWNPPVEVANLSLPISALQLASSGPAVFVAASSNGSTYLYSASTPYSSWAQFGPALPGSLGGIAATPEEVAAATVAVGGVYATTLAISGIEIGQANLTPTGTGRGGILSDGVTLTPYGTTYLEAVAFAVGGSDTLQLSTSTNGELFSPPAVIGAFSVASPNASLDQLGDTSLTWAGGTPGQLAFSSIGSDLMLLYTTNQSGETVPALQVSGDNGSSWNGPYLSLPVNGSVTDPSLAVGPTGLAYATWEEPDVGPGALDVATYLTDGSPVGSPETLAAAAQDGLSPVAAPAIAVDGFARPLVLWASAISNDTADELTYTGGYLSANTTLNLTQSLVSSTLGAPDLENPANLAGVGSLLNNTTKAVGQIDANLTAGSVCNAQNLTALELYANLTHYALTVPSGTGTACSSSLDPDAAVSPLQKATGLQVPNTFDAVYADWALEAEGVQVSISPLSNLSEVAPYSSLALSASLPAPTTASETVDSKPVSVTVTPEPYSPTAYELAVSDDLPSWSSSSGGECYVYIHDEGWYPAGTYSETLTTSVSATWTNVSVGGGTTYSFNGTTAYPSVWVDNLTADQSYSWTASFAARTSEEEAYYSTCTHSTVYSTVSPVTLGPSAIESMTETGTFATTLAVDYSAGFLEASLSANRTYATIHTNLNTTLPATVQSSLSGAGSAQSSSSSTFETDQAFSFGTAVPVGSQYVFSLSASSRVGSTGASGSNSFAYGATGAAPAESAGASCEFALSSSVPQVWMSNATLGAWPYSNITDSTVQVTWYSNQPSSGFFTYNETGSSVNETIRGIQPVAEGPGNWSYTVEVYGLSALAAYGGSYGVSWDEGCLVEEDQLYGQVPHSPSDPGFATTDALALNEADLPFDSVTDEGGGINLTWSTPSVVTKDKASLLGGYVTLVNRSSSDWTTVIPVSPSEVVTVGATNGLPLAFPLSTSDKYTATLSLNYTGLGTETTTSKTFTYHEDSSKDGLTNSEKTAGWDVQAQPAGAVVFTSSETLEADLFASSVTIERGVTLTTDGYSIVVSGAFVNDGTIDTGLADYAACPAYGNTSGPSNSCGFPFLASSCLSDGGSGGGAFNNTTGKAEALAETGGLSTMAAGGGGGTDPSAGRSASASDLLGCVHSSTSQPTVWETYVLHEGWNESQGALATYLSGAAGGGAWVVGLPGSPAGMASGGDGGFGLYLQASSITTGTIDSEGGAGSTAFCNASGDFAGGGGGGGSLLFVYENGHYTQGSLEMSGGPGGACSSHARGAVGGSGGVIKLDLGSWPPPYTPPLAPQANSIVRLVHPTVGDYSTNGLANDYLEKEYGLDPNTVDTAGSDMLDLWNLTFNLGPVPTNQPADIRAYSGIQAWNEVNDTSWDPWGPSGTPNANGTDIACTSASQCPGNSSGSSSTLWSGTGKKSALSQFMNLTGVKHALEDGMYLRGVVGTCPAAARLYCYTDGTPDRLLTLWGKLSWGANPVVSSTPGLGFPDGSRLNPLGGTDLQVTVTNWTVDSAALAAGDGVAAYINATSGGLTEYSNFTNQTTTAAPHGESTSYSGPFVVTFPVDPSQQYVDLNLSLVANLGSGLLQLLRSPVLTVDLERASLQSLTVWNNSFGSELRFEWQSLPTFAKAPTWIYVPDGNETLSALPSGLRRYTGEQNFIELVINDTAAPGESPNITGLPYANNTSAPQAAYAFGLAPGLNTLLVPRSVFPSTPFGLSVLNLSGDAAPDIPIAAANGDGFLQREWASEGDGAQWFNRTTGVGSNNTTGQPDAIEVVANTTTVNSTNDALIGGVPANPSLERGYSTLAIQAIYAFNESSMGQVEGLLAGLLLNSTGNFSGWLFNATADLPSLGLIPAVLAPLPNATYVNDGGYGPPTSTATRQTHRNSWLDFGADWKWFWNSVSGVVSGAISLVWSAEIAAAAFDAELAAAAGRFELAVFSQQWATLEKVGDVILAASESLTSSVLSEAEHLLAVIVGTIKGEIAAVGTAFNDAFAVAMNGIVALANGTLGFTASFDGEFEICKPLASLFGWISPLVQGLEMVSRYLQPVSALITPTSAIDGIGAAFGYNGSKNLAEHAASLEGGWAGTVAGWSYTALADGLNAIGIGSGSLSPPTGDAIPTTGQLQTASHVYQQTTGDSSIPNLLWRVLSSPTILDSVLDFVQTLVDLALTVVVGSVIAEAIVGNQLLASPAMALAPDWGLVEGVAKIPYANFFFQAAGLVLDMAGMWFATNHLFKFEDGMVGAFLAWFPLFDSEVSHLVFEDGPDDPYSLVGESLLASLGVATGYADMCTSVSHCV
jgi:hypothetical protein